MTKVLGNIRLYLDNRFQLIPMCILLKRIPAKLSVSNYNKLLDHLKFKWEYVCV